jgi:molybdopterin/thiamine biosynthesis adenylyltransferase
VLFDEEDVRLSLPKAVAAANRLRRINSTVQIDPQVVDVHAGNIEELAGLDSAGHRIDLILDGTDNVQTRYLINDLSAKHGIPWIYGAVISMEGRVMPVLPGRTPCLRCIFPEPPVPGELATCDTAGVLGSAVNVVASLQAATAIKLLTGHADAVAQELVTLDLWTNRFLSVSLENARRDDCPTCGQRHFEFLNSVDGLGTTSLCGRNAVQIRFVAMQNHYNVIYREEEREMFPLCRDEGIGVLPWSPLARGFVMGNRKRDSAETVRGKTDDYGKGLYYQPEDFDVVDRITEVARNRGVSNAQVALAWVLQQPGVTSPIVGASKMHQLDDAVGALNVKLDDAELKRLAEPYKAHPILGHS